MSRIVMNMDFSWKFHRGDIINNVKSSHSIDYAAAKAGNATGAAGKVFFDGDFREVDLPHDYYAESEILPENRHSHGYRSEDNAWYRKSFLLDESLSGKELLLVFEGTAVNAEFYFNGSLMARSFSAYTETVFDITDRAYFGKKPNTLAVYINGKVTEGWWYEGAGIYRHVKLYVKDKLHIAHNGIFGKPVLKEGTKNSWCLHVETMLENSNYVCRTAAVRATILDGETVIAQNTSKAVKIDYASKLAVNQILSVSRPVRWDIDNPKLYTLKCEVIDESGAAVDEASERIGFRTIRIDADKGFFLNEKPLKIKGTCNHQDHAGVGVALPDSVQYYRIKRLKEMGTNAYRCSHNLPTKEILDACDELGMIVMDENRRFESRDEVLEYLDIMVRRDRNHPSVVFWSLFNEEPLQNTEEGAKIYRRMRSVVSHLDDSRIITGAINGSMEGAGLEMDVTGINYSIHEGGKSEIDGFHAKYPNQPIIGSENNSAVTTRGCYKSDREGAQVLSNYDEETVPWGATVRDDWKFAMEREWYAGIFIWTGFDYRGEPTPFEWPSVSSQFGIMDTCGFAKDSFYYNKACFEQKPMIHLLPHWNFKKGDIVRVAAPTNCDEAELFLNGRSLGRKSGDCINTPEWQVEYAPGRILVKGYRGGRCVAKAERRTAGKPYAIKIMSEMTSIKNDGADTAVINFAVVDKKGVVVPYADNLIKFTVVGGGHLRGVGNGDPNSHESDILPERRAYCGLCQALITSNIGAESIKIVAESEGLLSAEFELDVKAVKAPVCPEVAMNTILDRFTMSKVYDEKPEPLMHIADDDQNSFTPVTFVSGAVQEDFNDGWRIYRVKTEAAMDGNYALKIVWGVWNYAEIYVNGNCINRAEKNSGPFVTAPFALKKGENADIRFLLYAEDRKKDFGAGFADYIAIEKV
ncbi:MAG: beta-galactosidase GalA [Eubacteriales bacterium]